VDVPSRPLRPGLFGVAAVYLGYAAIAIRALVQSSPGPLLPWYVGLLAVFLILFSAVWWRPVWLHAYFVLQSIVVLGLLTLNPALDFVTAYFVLLCYQAGLFLGGRTRWAWVGAFMALIAGSLMFFYGPLQGLALALTSMAICVVFPAYVIANAEIETARAESQAVLAELQVKHRQLQAYADQVEVLAAVEERNRLARDLHDSVSQTMFSILLHARSTQLLLERDPAQVRSQLGQLQDLTHSALAQMRGLIAQLRLQND
jgi:signal transduction histidine kinase